MIVIDVGCARYGGDYSLERLIDLYAPDTLLGFDPDVNGLEAARETVMQVKDGPSLIELLPVAVWTYVGEIGFFADGLNGQVGSPGWPKVRCIDLAALIEGMAVQGKPIILKLDAEGSEYELLRHLIDTGANRRLTKVLVEWHEPDRGRAWIEQEIGVPLEEWRW